MSENNYGALMMKSAVGASDDINAIFQPGIYIIPPSNTSSPDATGGVLIVHSGTPIRRTFTSSAVICLTSTRNGSTWSAWKGPLSRTNPFADIKADGAAAIAEALSNLGLGTAAKRNVDAGLINGIPDMASFRATVLPNGVFKIDVIGAGGGKQKLVFQWGIIATAPGSNAAYNVNEAFPNEILWASGGRGAPGSNAGMGVSPEGTQQIRIQNYAPSGVPENCFWWAIGW